MTDVIPFDPNRRRKGQRPPRPPVPDDEKFLHQRTQRAGAGARALAAEQAREHLNRYGHAQTRQANAKLIAAGKPVPARITLALNFHGLEGPEVDTAVGTWEGNPAGDVDMWEVAAAGPSREQVKLLSDLTGFPEVYFYLPIDPGPLVGKMWICYSRKVDGSRCHSPEPDWVDERGVLHYGGEPPRTQPPNQQSALF